MRRSDVFIDKWGTLYLRAKMGPISEVPGEDINTVSDVCTRLGFSIDMVLDDVQWLYYNEKVRRSLIDSGGLQNELVYAMATQKADEAIANNDHCYKCKRSLRRKVKVCPDCDFDCWDHAFSHYDEAIMARMDVWDSRRKIALARKYVTKNAPPASWILGPDNAYIFLRPRQHKRLSLSKIRNEKKLTVNRGKFEDLSKTLLNLYRQYTKARQEANVAAEKYMRDNGPRYRMARTVDLWLYPKAERNKDIFVSLKADQQENLVDQVEDLREHCVGVVSDPERDYKAIEKGAANLAAGAEMPAAIIANMLKSADAALARLGSVDQCQELANELAGEFFLSKAGRKYFEDEIEPFFKAVADGDEESFTGKFWAKVWPQFADEDELKKYRKKLKTPKGRIKAAFDNSALKDAQKYYDRFKMGLSIFQKIAAPLADIATEPNLPYDGKVTRYLSKLMSKRFSIKVRFEVKMTRPRAEGSIPVRQIRVASVGKVPRWPGRVVLHGNMVAGLLGDCLTPFNLFIAFSELAKKIDDKNVAAFLGELFGGADLAVRIAAARGTLGISGKTAAVFGKVAGTVGGAANAYTGVRNFYSDMDYMELDKGICDLLIAAGGMFAVGGVFTGGILTLVGFVLGIIGGIGKWLFADSDEVSYIKGTRYYFEWTRWHKENGYTVMSDRWRNFAIGHPTIEQIEARAYWMGFRFRIDMIGAHNGTIYFKFFEEGYINKEIDDFRKDFQRKGLMNADGYYEAKMRQGIAEINIPQNPFMKAPRNANVLVKAYHKDGREYKSFHTSDPTYRKVLFTGTVPRSGESG